MHTLWPCKLLWIKASSKVTHMCWCKHRRRCWILGMLDVFLSESVIWLRMSLRLEKCHHSSPCVGACMIESQKNHSYTRLRGGQAHFNDYQNKSAFVLFILHSTEAIVLWMDVSEDKVISHQWHDVLSCHCTFVSEDGMPLNQCSTFRMTFSGDSNLKGDIKSVQCVSW